ncbi:hypothetical protein QAD02_007065, partial [Eretmocerus hayati]
MDGDAHRERRPLSTSSEERATFHVTDLQDSSPSPELPHHAGDDGSSPQDEPHHLQQQHRRLSRHNVQRRPSSSLERAASSGPQRSRRNSSAVAPTGSQGRPRRQRRPSEFSEHSLGRRSSNCPVTRPRANSCARPTPLGDGRRASACRSRPQLGATTVGAASSLPGPARTGRRRSSVAPGQLQLQHQWSRRGSRSPSDALLTPTMSCSLDAIEAAATGRSLHRGSRSASLAAKDPELAARIRRHRRIASVLLATFLFILAASVLAVIVTLTHSSFYKPSGGPRELAEHRGN